MTSPTDKTRTIRKNKRSAAARVRKNAVKKNGSTPRLFILPQADASQQKAAE